jgi:hypothetical protein
VSAYSFAPSPLAGEGGGGLMKTTLILGVLALFGF